MPPCVWGECDFHVNWLHVSRIRPTHWRLNHDFDINQQRCRLTRNIRVCMCVCVCVCVSRCTVTPSVRGVTECHQQTATTNARRRSTSTTSVANCSDLLCRPHRSSLSSTSTPARPRSTGACPAVYPVTLSLRRRSPLSRSLPAALVRCTTLTMTRADQSDVVGMAARPSVAAAFVLRRLSPSTYNYTYFFAILPTPTMSVDVGRIFESVCSSVSLSVSELSMGWVDPWIGLGWVELY